MGIMGNVPPPSPNEVWQWLVIAGVVIGSLFGVVKLVEWWMDHFPSRKEFTELKEKVAALESKSNGITDAAREEKHLRLFAEYIVEAAENRHRRR